MDALPFVLARAVQRGRVSERCDTMAQSILFYVTLVPWFFMLASLLSLCISYLFSAVRYGVFVSFFGHVLKVRESFIITTAIIFLSNFFPRGGSMLAKPYMTKHITRKDFQGALFGTMFEQFFEMSWQVFALPVMLFFYSEKVLFNSAVTLAEVFSLTLLGLVILFVLRKRIFVFLFSHKDKVPGLIRRKLVKYQVTRENMVKFSSQAKEFMKDYRRNALILIFTAGVFFMNALALYLLFVGASVHVTFFESILVYWVSMIVGKFSGIPGGFGARDLTSIGMLASFGVALDIATSLTVLFRLLLLVVPVFVGGPVVLVFMKMAIKRHDADDQS